MSMAKWFAVAVLALAVVGWRASGQDDVTKMSVDDLIGELSSRDGTKRTLAAFEIFRRGKEILPDLKEAGAKQIAPVGGTVDGTTRLDMVYSVLEGFPPNAPKARSGYRNNSFGIHVEKGTTAEDIQKICKKYQCTLAGKFNPDSRPNCYLEIGAGLSLDAVIRQILTSEGKVVTINLNYFEG